MIEELRKDYKKRLIKKDQEETDKIFKAIHEQAYWNRQEEENKRMMANIDRELRKPTKKDKIKEVLKHELETALLLIMSLPGIAAWLLLFYLIANR